MTPIAKALGIDVDFYSVFIIWGLIFVRIFVMLLLTPFLGTKAVPSRSKVATAAVLAVFMYPLIAPPIIDTVPENSGFLLALFFKEAFFGLTIGLVTIMVFYALESAGRIVDAQRGGANAQVFVPQLGQVSIFGLFNFWLAIAFFITIGGHRQFLETFLMSFKTVPLLEMPHLAPGLSPFLEHIIHLSGDVLVIAVQLSAPVLIAILLVDVVLGIANKMAPQINVFELGFGIKGYVAPLMIYISIYLLVTQMGTVMQAMIHSVDRLIHLFAA